MQEYIDFSLAMLDAIAIFLQTPPISYLFGMILFCFIAEFIMILCGRR